MRNYYTKITLNYILKNVQKYIFCFHSKEFQDHSPIVSFPPRFLTSYNLEDAEQVTNDEIKEMQKIAEEEIGKLQIKRGNFRTEFALKEFTLSLIDAYAIVLTNVKIKNGKRKMFIKIEDLLAMNNIITSSSNWQLRKIQLQYKEGEKLKWRMDVRVIKYHLLLINDLFNRNKIEEKEYRTRFTQIYPFEFCNELVLRLLFLGEKNG